MYSYFIHAGRWKINETVQVGENLSGNKMTWTMDALTQIGIFSAHPSPLHYHDKDYFLVGKIDNLKRLATKYLVPAEQHELETCVLLIEKMGMKIIGEWKGCYAFIINDRKKEELKFTIGNTGLMQSYIIAKPGEIILTSELKAFCKTNFFERKMIPIETYQYEYTKEVSPDFCFLQDVKRVIPGFLYSIDYRNTDQLNIEKESIAPIRASVVAVSKEEVKENIYRLLNENISDKINNTIAGIPISGGLDSGLVASMVAANKENIYTYTIGTAFGNEFENAKDVHEFLHSDHEEIHIDEAGFWEGFLQSVWHNEICDPLYAEGYVGFYHAFKHAKKNTKQVFTGYGADLILGDFLLIRDKPGINAFSEYCCRRAAWSGEMSPYVALSLGLEVQHPFWESGLINFSLSIPYEYKYAGDEVKAVLREMAEEKKLLPHRIAWRKKNAFTTGASLDQLFSSCLKIPYEKNYRFKSIFLYYLFEELFVTDTPLQKINIQQLIAKTNTYARECLTSGS